MVSIKLANFEPNGLLRGLTKGDWQNFSEKGLLEVHIEITVEGSNKKTSMLQVTLIAQLIGKSFKNGSILIRFDEIT